MKKLPQHLEDTLLDYLDGTLTPSQRQDFEQSLKTNEALQGRLEEMRNAEQMLRYLTPDQPSKNFTLSVMSRLDQYPSRAGLSIRNGILLLIGIFTVMGMAMMLMSAGVFDETATFDLNNIGLVQRYIKQTLPSIPFDGRLVVNIIILLNLALAFVVLDRAILRPIFQKRMQTGH
jgi:hypothetical protein